MQSQGGGALKVMLFDPKTDERLDAQALVLAPSGLAAAVTPSL